MPLGTKELWPQFPFVPVWFVVQLTLTGYAEARILRDFGRKFPHIFHFFSPQRQFAGRVMATFLGNQMRNKASGRGENSAYVASTDPWHLKKGQSNLGSFFWKVKVSTKLKRDLVSRGVRTALWGGTVVAEMAGATFLLPSWLLVLIFLHHEPGPGCLMVAVPSSLLRGVVLCVLLTKDWLTKAPVHQDLPKALLLWGHLHRPAGGHPLGWLGCPAAVPRSLPRRCPCSRQLGYPKDNSHLKELPKGFYKHCLKFNLFPLSLCLRNCYNF